MMTLDEYLKQGDELAGKATKGPWGSDYCGDVFTKAEYKVVEGLGECFKGVMTTRKGPDSGNGAFCADSRTRVVVYAKLIRELVKAIEFGHDAVTLDALNLLDESFERGEFHAE